MEGLINQRNSTIPNKEIVNPNPNNSNIRTNPNIKANQIK
jgi:hypothetical protein